LQQWLELNSGCIAIDEQRHGKLIAALRTAVEKEMVLLTKRLRHVTTVLTHLGYRCSFGTDVCE